MNMNVVVPLRLATDNFGAKAKNIKRLEKKGFRVPETWLLSCDHHDSFIESGTTPTGLTGDLERLLSGGAVAIRSSADVEDGSDISHAGEFMSILDVKGVDDAIESIKEVWRSSASVRSAGETIRMGVMIQRMVGSRISGVSFSRDPVTGEKATVIEWTPGTGIDLVQRGVNVEHLRVESGGRCDGPNFMGEVVKGTGKAESLFGRPVDLEWSYDGRDLWWLQVRPITGMNHLKVYSNRISREYLPGLIHPLVWSLNVPLVNGAWIRLMSDLLGDIDVRPEDLSRRFFCRAYFNMGAMGEILGRIGMPDDSLEILQGMENGRLWPRPCPQLIMFLPRLLRFLIRLPDVPADAMESISRLRMESQRQYGLDLGSLSDDDLLIELGRVIDHDSEAAYWNILVPLLAQFYGRRGSEGNGRCSHSIHPEIDPSMYFYRLNSIYVTLNEDARTKVRTGNMDVLRSEPAFALEFQELIERFGHLSSSGNDISKPTWREMPEQVLMMIPHQKSIRKSVGGGRSRSKRETVGLLKDRISFEYTRGYGLLRLHYQEIGRRLSHRDLLDDEEDVFFLTREEAHDLLVGKGSELRELVEMRRDEMDRSQHLKPPEVIFGDVPPPLDRPVMGSLKGLGTSGGRYTGTVVTVRGMGDFKNVQKGDVLVIPHSDVAWIPLFNIAGAIVAEAGGYLAHSSIVARELGLPAVVSVDGALSQVSDGMTVTVDGFEGVVTLH